MLKVAVCDDSEIFSKNAADLIARWSDESGIPAEVSVFSNGDDLISAVASNDTDIIFLDIIMPLLNGMDTARELRQKNKAVRIIFLTSSPEFALESYEVKAQGYILKPVTYEKISEALDECAEALSTEPENIILKTQNGFKKIYFHDIEFAEAQNKKVIFHLKSGKTDEVYEPLHTFENRFTETDGFFKCHRRHLVFLPNVDRFSGTEIITKSGKTVPIARGSAKAFKEAYFRFMFNEG